MAAREKLLELASGPKAATANDAAKASFTSTAAHGKARRAMGKKMSCADFISKGC